MELTAKDLLHGAMYAMEQAGHLLEDAVALHEKGRYSTAVALAIFSREELGKAKIILEIRKRALTSGTVSGDAVKAEYSDHIEKLRHGQTRTILRWTAEQSETTMKGLWAPLQSPELKQADGVVDRILRRIRNEGPNDMDQLRMRALYVDPVETSGKWNRPVEMTEELSWALLENVANDYAGRCDGLMMKDDELANAIAQWSVCPPLPDAARPRWPRGPS